MIVLLLCRKVGLALCLVCLSFYSITLREDQLTVNLLKEKDFGWVLGASIEDDSRRARRVKKGKSDVRRENEHFFFIYFGSWFSLSSTSSTISIPFIVLRFDHCHCNVVNEKLWRKKKPNTKSFTNKFVGICFFFISSFHFVNLISSNQKSIFGRCR